MKRYSTFFFLSICLLVLISCSDKLDRSKAEKEIKKFYEYPNVELISIYTRLDGSIWGSYAEKYNALQEANLINIEEGRTSWWGPNHYVHFTEIGNNFKVGEEKKEKVFVVSNKRDFKEVTGISLIDENNAKVEFSAARNSVTQFGKILEGFKEGDIINYSVNMKKYDDGWRIINDKIDNITPEEVSGAFLVTPKSEKTSQIKVINIGTMSTTENVVEGCGGWYSKNQKELQQNIYLFETDFEGNLFLKIDSKILKLKQFSSSTKEGKTVYKSSGCTATLIIKTDKADGEESSIQTGTIEIEYDNKITKFDFYGSSGC
jgi:hypothetical protein